jgi:carboxyl-terminal processing protease
MPRVAALSVLLLAAAVCPGAPRPAAPTTAGPPAQQFAVQFLNVAQQVNTQYLRPVPVPDLVHAAVTGLYEKARIPAPADLRQRVDAANARGELVLVIQEAHARAADPLAALGRDPMTVACQAMFRSLDPYSAVIGPDEKRRNVALDQEAQGVGVALDDHTGAGPLVVRNVYPGGSAQRAGLRPGDQITQVNGEAVEKPGADAQHAANLAKLLLESPPDDPLGATQRGVTVTFRRPGGRPSTVELQRQNFRVETVLGTGRDDGHQWHYWADYPKRIGHVRITMMAHGVSDELAAALADLQADGLRGLVLDLRWTPGGYLDDSVELVRLFLGDVPVATIKSRNEEDIVYRGGGPSKLADLPLVVLVNGETSGGAELIAAALQDHGRARVVGQRTLGKGSVQRPLQVDLPGVPMKVTTGTFVRPSGKNLHRFPDSKATDDWGVKPDVEFRVSPQFGRELKAWWLAQTLRPGPSMDRLPLDDLTNDAQLRAAVDLLAR